VSALAAALALALQTAPSPADEAVALVGNFLSVLDRDPAAAQAMLADDAQIGVGDVGGPMTAALFISTKHELDRLCRQTGLVRSTRPFAMPGRSVVLVSGTYHCVSEERPEGHDIQIDYLVEHGRVAGAYIDAGTGLRDGNHP
jgi:hypothetical protein